VTQTFWAADVFVRRGPYHRGRPREEPGVAATYAATSSVSPPHVQPVHPGKVVCFGGNTFPTALDLRPTKAAEFTYRTGPFSGSGIPIANGIADYFAMLNERDGGIGGVKPIVEDCETGYDTKKGIECYEAVKGKNPVVITPYSTGSTLQLIPKASVDKIPILSMAYGLSASADGNVFPWIFNPPATYWDGASMFVKYAAQVGSTSSRAKRSASCTSTRRTARSRSRCSRPWARITASN
jgi:ABC-type branched-subunit amino acid transport system substrate-binding protein